MNAQQLKNEKRRRQRLKWDKALLGGWNLIQNKGQTNHSLAIVPFLVRIIQEVEGAAFHWVGRLAQQPVLVLEKSE